MAQTIEGFVGSALDEAKITPLHRKVIGLIAAGYFFDVIDFTIFGSLVPYILQSSRHRSGSGRHRQRHDLRHVHRHGGSGPAQRPLRTPLHLPVQPACCSASFTILVRLRPERDAAGDLPLYCRSRPRRRAALVLRLCRRIFAEGDPRQNSRLHPLRRRRLRVADRHRDGAAWAPRYSPPIRNMSGAGFG